MIFVEALLVFINKVNTIKDLDINRSLQESVDYIYLHVNIHLRR